MTRATRIVPPLVLLVAALAACGGTPTASAPSATSSPPVTASPSASPTPSASPSPSASPAPTATPARVAARCAPADVPVLALTAPDGARLAAVVRGTGRRGVVLGHESDGGICDLWAFGGELAAEGYQVLAMDFEGYGGSTSGTRAPGPFVEPYAEDLLAGVAHLRSLGVRDIALVGPSMGGTAAVVAAAAAQDRVRAVVDLSGPATFLGLDSVAAARASTVPQLLAVTTSDRNVDVEDLQAVDAASAATDKQLLVRPGSAHGTQLLADPQVLEAVRTFLGTHLRP